MFEEQLVSDFTGKLTSLTTTLHCEPLAEFGVT